MEKHIYNWNLKKMIVESGLKQTWIANKTGVDAAIFTKYITGGRPVPQEKRKIIAGLLQCKEKDIFKK